MKIKGFGINADALQEDDQGKKKLDLNGLARNLDHFTDMDFEFVEIPLHRLREISEGSFSPSYIEKIRRILSGFPFKYTVHGPDPLNIKNKENISSQRENLIKSLEFAHALDSEILVFHPGKFAAFKILDSSGKRRLEFTRRNVEKMLALEREMLYSAAKKAEKLGITIAIENTQPYVDRSPYSYSELLSLLRIQVDTLNHPNIGITLDVGHAFLSANFYGFNFLEEIAKTIPYIRHAHIHDNLGKVGKTSEKGGAKLMAQGYGDLHLPMGFGKIPVDEVLSLLQNCPCVILHEIHNGTKECAKEALKLTKGIMSEVA
ncbi:MAG: TIM barrel protein [Clostridia bacterium]|nr:TIM barrel protein [Clostridia bacterium]